MRNKGEPPTIISHDTADTTIPFKTVERFRDAMKKKGNTCELVPFEGKRHGFFNFERDRESFDKTVRAADDFLVSHGRAVVRCHGEPH
jgi:dienelactone hydrolase